MADRQTILVLNGPNLQLLGTRRPEVYGSATLHDVEEMVRASARECGFSCECRQSNHEGDLVDWIGATAGRHDVAGLVLNAGAYTHTSLAIRDAVEACGQPAVEVHISNIHAREAFRHRSLLAPVCIGQISGFGIVGYALAVRALADYATT